MTDTSPSSSSSSSNSKKKKGCILFFVLLVIAGISVAIYFLRDEIGITNSNKSNTSTNDDTKRPTIGSPTQPTTTKEPSSSPTMTPNPTISATPTMSPTDKRTGLIGKILQMNMMNIQQDALDWLINTDTWYPMDDDTTTSTIENDVSIMLERYALVAFSFSTKGDRWWVKSDNWLDTTLSVCDGWFGIDCNDQGHVTAIELVDNSLVGSFHSSSIGYLTELQSLIIVGSYEFATTIPKELSKLSKLEILNLKSNYIGGKIPSDILKGGGESSLSTIDLSNNVITGQIPTEINTMTTNLISFIVTGNELSNSIPNISSLTSLVRLDLARNKLENSIPSLSSLVSLQFLDLSGNDFVGTIPVLPEQSLVKCDFDWNKLTDTINGEMKGCEVCCQQTTGGFF